jgi:hypothetical protein
MSLVPPLGPFARTEPLDEGPKYCVHPCVGMESIHRVAGMDSN